MWCCASDEVEGVAANLTMPVAQKATQKGTRTDHCKQLFNKLQSTHGSLLHVLHKSRIRCNPACPLQGIAARRLSLHYKDSELHSACYGSGSWVCNPMS